MDERDLILAKYMFGDVSIVKCKHCGELKNIMRGIHMCELDKEVRKFYVELPKVVLGVGVFTLIILFLSLWIN